MTPRGERKEGQRETAVDAGTAAPVESNEPATPAATPENVAAPAPGTEAAPDVETQAEKKSFTQEELNEIIQKEKAKAEAKAERRALKAYRETLEKFAPQQRAETTPPADTGRPTQAQFENVDDYVEALADWKIGQRDQQAAASPAGADARGQDGELLFGSREDPRIRP